jgi:hypothetical protein
MDNYELHRKIRFYRCQFKKFKQLYEDCFSAVPCDPTTITLNENFLRLVQPCSEDINFTLQDQDLNTVPYTLNGNTIQINCEGGGGECEPVHIYFNDNPFAEVTCGEDFFFYVTDQNDNPITPLSVSGNTIQVNIPDCCEETSVSFNDEEPLALDCGDTNFLITDADETPLTILSVIDGVIRVDTGCPTLCEQISESDWETIKNCLNEQQIEDVTADLCETCNPVEISVNGDLEVTAAAGTSSNITTINQSSTPIVPMAINVTGNDIEIQVNVPEPSGIAYFEPNDMAYPLPSFADYDDGWREVNGVFRRTKPAYAIYCQKLNISSIEPRITLQFNNVHGTTDRYTREDGSITPVTTDQVIVRDHLTGKEWIEWQITPNLWVDLLNEAYARGWFLPSQQEFISVRNNSSGTVDMLGRIMITSSQAQVFGTTNPANTTNYLGSNNLQVPYASYDKSLSRRTMLLVRNGTF